MTNMMITRYFKKMYKYVTIIPSKFKMKKSCE